MVGRVHAALAYDEKVRFTIPSPTLCAWSGSSINARTCEDSVDPKATVLESRLSIL